MSENPLYNLIEIDWVISGEETEKTIDQTNDIIRTNE